MMNPRGTIIVLQKVTTNDSSDDTDKTDIENPISNSIQIANKVLKNKRECDLL